MPPARECELLRSGDEVFPGSKVLYINHSQHTLSHMPLQYLQLLVQAEEILVVHYLPLLRDLNRHYFLHLWLLDHNTI